MIAKYHIMVVATYGELAEEALEIQEEAVHEILIRSADMTNPEKIREVASEARQKNIDAFISRGGTALELRKVAPEIPTAEIPVTGFDLLEAIYGIKDRPEKMAIVGYPNVIHGAFRVASILGVKPEEIVDIKDREDCDRKLESLRTRGTRLILGDNLATRRAKELGFAIELIRSGKEGLVNAYNEAERLVRVRNYERARSEQMRIIFNYVNNGIIGTDHEGIVTAINPAALQILGLSRKGALGKPVSAVFEPLSLESVMMTREKELGAYYERGDRRMFINKVPIISKGEVSGVVATLQEVTKTNRLSGLKEISQKGHLARYSFKDIIGSSPAIKNSIDKAEKYSKVDSVVLLYGETGTGKELFAQGIHNASPRHRGPFVAVNCAAIPESLLESELFGYVKGAFTDARREGKIGLFEQAEGGTILLDEITELPVKLQTRLLRVLQEKEVTRIGDDRVRSVDVRIIATTNKDPYYLLANNLIREDLYYRINILTLELPPLRERRKDIKPLAEHFLTHYARLYNKIIWEFSGDAMKLLESYHWPGNVRELQATVERVTVESGDNRIKAGLLHSLQAKAPAGKSADEGCSLEELTRNAIAGALERSGGSRAKAAELLGIDRSTLWRKLKTMEHNQ